MSQYEDSANQEAVEKRIIEALRTLKPFERIEITADKDGKPGTLLVHRSSKFILTFGGVTYVK